MEQTWFDIIKLWLGNETVMHSIIGCLTLLVGGLGITWRKPMWRKIKSVWPQREHDITEDYSVNASHINQRLHDLKETLDCSRVAIIQFRNGSTFTSSNPMFRVYCSFEALRNGVSPSYNLFSDKLGTCLIDMLGPILNETVKEPGTETLEFCPNKKCPKSATKPRLIKFETECMRFGMARSIFEEAGIRVLYALPLFSGRNPIGALLVHYIVNTDTDDNVASQICALCETSHYAQQMLDRHVPNPTERIKG